MTYREMLIKNLTDKRPSSFQNRIAGASNIDSSINRLLDKLNALELIFPASYEKVKKVALLDREFEIEKGEITPTLKVKRNIIEQKYQGIINTLYQE